jgi:hypothetical protein
LEKNGYQPNGSILFTIKNSVVAPVLLIRQQYETIWSENRSSTAKQERKHVKDTILFASQYSKLRIKNAGVVVKDKLAFNAIEVGKAADTPF